MSEVALLSIGEFARASGLTPKALRLYDELGLVVPAEVDRFTGYRRYAPDQLATARLVATLRLIGMPLRRIEAVLGTTASGAAAEISAYWSQVEADVASRHAIVTALLGELRPEDPPMPDTLTLHPDAGVSHRIGRRDRQQDAVLFAPGLLAVADGFGVRDDLADAALRAFAADGLDAARAAAAPLADLPPGDTASGTTLTAVRLGEGNAHITHVGDARAWLVRDGSVRQLTHDHTLVAALLESGRLTPEEARSHPHRTLLNRALLPGTAVDELTVEVREGDRLVLTTDGVHAHLDEADLARLLGGSQPAQQVADLVAAEVAGAGESDNHTIVVVDVVRA